MWTEHPTSADLEELLCAPSDPSRAQQRTGLIRHLLAGEAVSWTQATGRGEQRLHRLLLLSGTEVRRIDEVEPNCATYDYSSTFSAAERSLTCFFEQEHPLEEQSDTLVTELLGLSPTEQVECVATPRFAHPAVVRLLVEQSHAVRYDDPQRMLHLADLARRSADACSVEYAGNEQKLADTCANGWMHYGNALRVCGQHHEADDAFAKAQRFLLAGTGDPLLRARWLQQLASLRTSQSQLGEATEVADQAAEIYRTLGERHRLAQSMVLKATACLYAGETEKAVRVFNRTIPLIGPEESPHLLLVACHNLIRAYIDLEQPEQALSLYYEVRDLYREFDAVPAIRLRNLWQEGQLLRDLGHLSAAETALLEARKGFLERGIAYEVAVVSLDLASVYVRAGKLEELRRTVAEAVPIFRALRVGRETIAALLQLQQAAGKEQQALELIRLLNTRLAPLSQLPGK